MEWNNHYTQVNLNIGVTFKEWQTKYEFPYDCHGIIEYIDGVKEDGNCVELIKNNFITTESTSMLYAPAGQGKSTLAYQIAMQWCLGKPTFGLIPTKPLRSIFFQWEDTARKLKQFANGISTGLKLSGKDTKDINNGVIIANRHEVASKSQQELYTMMESYIKKFKPDIFWLNPISAFFEGDLSDATNGKTIQV